MPLAGNGNSSDDSVQGRSTKEKTRWAGAENFSQQTSWKSKNTKRFAQHQGSRSHRRLAQGKGELGVREVISCLFLKLTELVTPWDSAHFS